MSFIKNAQQKIAHTSLTSLGNRDLRSLQEVLNTEKEFVKTNAKSSADFQKSADAIKIWGEGEGEDLAVSRGVEQRALKQLDICSKIANILSHYNSAHTRFSSHLSTMRMHFKSIRTREEALADLKARKRSLGNKIEAAEKKLAKMGPENKDLMKSTQQLKDYRAEMESMHIEVRNEEAAIGDFKRRTTKEALGIKCGGLLEMAEKLTIIADIGKLMIEEIPLESTPPGMPRAPYNGYDKTNHLLQEAARCVADVGFAPASDPNALPAHLTAAPGGGTGDIYGNNPGDYSRDDDQGTTYHDTDGYVGGAGAYGGPSGPAGYGGENGQYGQQGAPDVEATTTTTPLFAKLNTTGYGSGGPNGAYPDPNSHTPNPEAQQARDAQLATRQESTGAADDWARSAAAAVAGAGTEAEEDQNQNQNRRRSASVDENDDSAYFASIGSTRAAQAAVRRPVGSSAGPLDRASSPPLSPSSTTNGTHGNNNHARWSGVPTVATVATASKAAPIRVGPPSVGAAAGGSGGGGGGAGGAAAGAGPTGYDGGEGRKTTAAAFRRGFARNMSGTGIPGAPSTEGVNAPPDNDPGQVQPLAIRKRNSAVGGDSPDTAAGAGGAANHNLNLTAVEGVSDAAPPYAPSDGGGGHATPQLGMPGGLGVRPPSPDNGDMRASVYGGIGDGGAGDIAPEALYPQQGGGGPGPGPLGAYHDPYAGGAPSLPPVVHVQPWAQSGYNGPGSREGSRPPSAAGNRPLPGLGAGGVGQGQQGQGQQGHYPSYATQGGW